CRQGQADYSALGGGVGNLADLAFIGSDARGVDDDAALLAHRLRRDETFGKQPQAVEGANQVDVDDPREFGQRIDAVLADDALRAADPGAIHQHPRDTVGTFGFGDATLDLILIGDVGMDGDALDFSGDFFGIFLALIEHGDFRAPGSHGACGGGAKSGAATGDENGNIFQLHL